MNENDPVQYLYRGTTRGWPGSKMARQTGITCTTTDPFVAAHFAIECRNKGPAVLLAMRRGLVEEARANHFALFENAVNLQISPRDFEARCEISVDLDRAIRLLESVGFFGIPIRVCNNAALHEILKETYYNEIRSSVGQLHLFRSLVTKEN